MRKYLLHALIISFVFLLTPTTQAAGENSDDATVYFDRGVDYLKSGMYKEAIEVLKVAIERDPEHAMSYYNLGILYNSSNDKDSALKQHEILNGLDFDLADKLFGLIRK